MEPDKKLLNRIIFITPLICGTAGFLLKGGALLDSVFSCVQMYVLNYSDTPPNILVEIARWTAPLVSAYSVLLAASALRKKLWDRIRSRRMDSVAVYGPEEYAAPVLAALGSSGISGGDVPAGTKRHILLWDEDENIRFWERNSKALAGSEVFIKSSSLPGQTAAGENVRIFCPEETAARLYWQRNCLYEASRTRDHRMKIVMIGAGRLAEEMISCALQINIFSPDQRIEYHIFGGDPSYLKIRHELGGLRDPVVFHEEQWMDCLPLLKEAERIIVLQQEGQTGLLSDLLLALAEKTVDVFSAGTAGAEILGENERIRSFPWKDLSFEPRNILSEVQYRRAKALNLRYAHLYSGSAETEEALDAEWRKLDTFTRYSNISSADYHEIRLAMLRSMGMPEDPDRIPGDVMELLSELEHMRWCRYHLLNNWTQGTPENGKSKDSVKRIHVDLMPYDRLSEGEKQKDRDSVRVLLELNR